MKLPINPNASEQRNCATMEAFKVSSHTLFKSANVGIRKLGSSTDTGVASGEQRQNLKKAMGISSEITKIDAPNLDQG
jgi:hypothetical protein